MINSISKITEPGLFNKLQAKAVDLNRGVQNLTNMSLSQKDILLRTIAQETFIKLQDNV